jgi:hypothetical protein
MLEVRHHHRWRNTRHSENANPGWAQARVSSPPDHSRETIGPFELDRSRLRGRGSKNGRDDSNSGEVTFRPSKELKDELASNAAEAPLSD